MVKAKLIPFKKPDVKKFIDKEINFWREQSLLHVSKRQGQLQTQGVRATIATLQLVRMNLFGSKLRIK